MTDETIPDAGIPPEVDPPVDLPEAVVEPELPDLPPSAEQKVPTLQDVEQEPTPYLNVRAAMSAAVVANVWGVQMIAFEWTMQVVGTCPTCFATVEHDYWSDHTETHA